MKYSAWALSLALSCAVCSTAVPVHADKGMFLFSAPPQRQVYERYGVELSKDWLNHAMLSAVRFNNGGSGGFVSADGLVITNHHIADEVLGQLSNDKCDYLTQGFLARSRADERPAPNLELNCLQSIEDVTDAVNSAVKPYMNAAQASQARLAKMAQLEKQSLEKTGLRSDVVTLYQGGMYHLYRYKKYTDVRLVWAPEKDVAAFGDDIDNFEYPRRSLDVALFRVYENGQPVHPQHYFKIASKPVAAGDPVFVVGSPGSTNRLHTAAWLTHHRNITLPYRLARVRTMEAALRQYAERGQEEARKAANSIRSQANSRKAYTGMFQGLLNDEIVRRHWRQDQELALKSNCPQAWEEIASALEGSQILEETYCLIEGRDACPGHLFYIARHLVRLAQEMPLPSEQRLREYRDSNLESLRQNIFSPEPIYSDLERAKLTAGFSFLAERLGSTSSDTAMVLQGKTPSERAKELINGTHLGDPEQRRRLASLSLEELRSCGDPMIELAFAIDERARTLRSEYDRKVRAPLTEAYRRISAERFRLNGQTEPPDATSTLRLSFGTVKGYQAEGQDVPYCTTFGDLFAKNAQAADRPPYVLPPSWLHAKDQLDMQTQLDFVSTADTIGGNSGSPVLSSSGEMVGVNFDRNQYGMVRNYVYDEVQARHISVSSAALLAALRSVYSADFLADELTAGSR
ncbi:MAG: S46 family peptidase [bacterium]|nr:S46 family peptidase [bacterium]